MIHFCPDEIAAITALATLLPLLKAWARARLPPRQSGRPEPTTVRLIAGRARPDNVTGD